AGKGDGSFSIPLSVPSGEYLFRAYTSWMKNFNPDLYYSQALTIFNTLNDSGADSATAPRGADLITPPRTVDPVAPARTADLMAPARSTDSPRASIRLFPEG